MKTSNNNGKTTANNDVRYFNIHTEAMGYLNGLEFVPGDSGGFHKAQFCMLEGNPGQPEKVYVCIIIKHDAALEVLRQFEGDINERATPVFAGLRLAKFRAQPFAYPKGHEQAGQIGVNYTARLIKLMYLKVGDHVVQLSEPSAPKTDFGVPSRDDVVDFERAPVVQLSIDDPNFQENKDRLSGMGYRWASGAKLWVLPTVTLDPKSPGFKAQGKLLQGWGFVNPLFDGVQWEYPLRQQRQSQQAQDGQRQGGRGNGSYRGHKQGGYTKQGDGSRNNRYQNRNAQNYQGQDYHH